MSRSTSVLVLVVLTPLLVGPPGASAQPADSTQLPEIAPREIEIRGEREIDLPSLERQPLMGFASPPQVPAVPADHRPYVGSYRQTLDDLPESLPIPETVSSSTRPTAAPTQGTLEAGSGRYFGRFFEGHVGVPLSATERLSVSGTYTGTEAAPNDDVAELEARLESQQEGIRLTGKAHGTLQRYALHGAQSPRTDPEREGYTGGGAVGLRATGSVPAQAEIAYENAQYTSYLDSTSNGSTLTQQQFRLQGASTLPLPFRPRLDALYQRSWLGGDLQNQIAYDVVAGATLALYHTETMTARVGGRVLAYATPALLRRPSIGDATATFISPIVNLEWQITEDTRLHVWNRPSLGPTSLDALYATNPYAEHAPTLRPALTTTNAEAGVTWSADLIRLVAAAGYRYAPNYRSFARTPSTRLYQINYNSARILHGRGQIALQGVEGVQALLELSLRDGALKAPNNDRDIPNFAPFTADAMVAVSFADGDGYVEAQTHFESPRYASTGGTDRLDSYLSLNLESSYALTSQFDIVVQAENLTGNVPSRSKWKNYPRPPVQVEAGVRLRW